VKRPQLSLLVLLGFLFLPWLLRAGGVVDLATVRELVPLAEQELDFDVHQPRGLAYHRGIFYLSSVETLERPEQLADGSWTPGKGRGHLLIFNAHGEILDERRLGEGDRFHPGGISSDGDRLWIPVAESRPDSRTTVYTFEFRTRKLRRVFDFPDHLAALAVDASRHLIYGYSWDSRYRYIFSSTGRMIEKRRVENGWHASSNAVVLPDGHLLSCGTRVHGVRLEGEDRKILLGGFSLETAAGTLSGTLPLSQVTEVGSLLTQGAFTLIQEESGPRFYFLPDPGEGRLLTFAPASAQEKLGPDLDSSP
jgi:hypothetical protein